MPSFLSALPWRRAAYAASAPLALAACASDRGTGPHAAPLDVSALVAQASLPEVTRAASATAPGAAFLALGGGTIPPAGCAWQAAREAFVCGRTAVGGLATEVAYAPLDAGGRVLRTPDRATTAALRVTRRVEGSLASPLGFASGGDSLRLAEQSTVTVGGLLEARQVVDGRAELELRAARAGTVVGAPWRVEQTVAGLVLPASGERWPRAGTVTTAGALGLATGTVRQTMTFDGTSRVAIVIEGVGSGARRCTFDLAAPSPGVALTCAD